MAHRIVYCAHNVRRLLKKLVFQPDCRKFKAKTEMSEGLKIENAPKKKSEGC